MRTTTRTSIAALCLGALAGCGGSGGSTSPTGSASPTYSSPAAPGAATHAPGPTQVAHVSHRPQSALDVGNTPAQSKVGRGGVQRAHTSGTSNDDNFGGAKPINPCALVSLSEARAITQGAVVGSMEAQLGPTCVYRSAGSSRSKSHVNGDITLAIESLTISQVARHMRQGGSTEVGGHRGYCGRLGTQMLLVPLRAGQVLNVTAPCVIASRFAVVALRRIPA